LFTFLIGPDTEGMRDPALYNIANLGLTAGIVAIVYLALERLVHSPWGRALRRYAKTNAAQWRWERAQRATAWKLSRLAAR
jgi:branched-chain amino acid transport system permease protein